MKLIVRDGCICTCYTVGGPPTQIAVRSGFECSGSPSSKCDIFSGLTPGDVLPDVPRDTYVVPNTIDGHRARYEIYYLATLISLDP